MLDYYRILGIPRSADYKTVRSAYKKLALQYHPDRNPNNKAAEDFFKVVNEAKQHLCDPQKRARYDIMLNYIYEVSQRKLAAQTYRPYQHPFGTYPRPGGHYYTPGTVYKIDKKYYREQLVTLAVVALISILSIGIFKLNTYLKEKKTEEIKLNNEKVLADAQELYDDGHYRLALEMVNGLIRKNPVDKKFFNRKESMVAGLNTKAIALYKNADYKTAVDNLEILCEYQKPMRFDTWNMIADCNFKLGNYLESINALEYIRARNKNDPELNARIGNIYYDQLNMTDKALIYYNDAKQLLEASLSKTYGEAFGRFVPGRKLPQIYFDMFSKRAEINVAAGNYKEAITDYNWAIYLRPGNARSYFYRALCKQQINNYHRACKDWERALALGFQGSGECIHQYCR